jgi:hypothetical protein
MNAASDFIQTLGTETLSTSQLESFVALLTSLASSEQRQESFSTLLRRIALNAEQAMLLAKSAPVQADLALQLSLKRYVRSKEFSLSHADEQARLSSPWALPFEFLKALTGFPPVSRSRRGEP